MLSLLKEISFVRLIIPFCLGIVSYVFLPFKLEPLVALIVFLFGFSVLGISQFTGTFQRNHYLQWTGGIFLFLLFFLAGHVFVSFRTEINSSVHFSRFIKKESRMLIQIDDPLVEKEKSFKTTGCVLSLVNNDTVTNVIGTVLVYLKKDSNATQLKYGDRIWVKNKFNELMPSKNPAEFNFKRFMGFKQVNQQIFLSPGDWIKSESKGGYLFLTWIYNLRQSLVNILRQHITDENSFSVGNSLILGLREKLDDELIKAYSSSGAMHVLAVSGLHIAIIYAILNSVFFFLDRNSKSKIVKSIINIAIIWGYATITGLSASVLRSAVMLSFVALGSNLKRVTNTYNILASSAFFLLLINPYFLMEVGFQLSYLAVLGIVMLQPRIYALFYTPNWLLDKIWMITAVSIAAQITTFPLGLLYYYQFPVYFLVSNLFVIPASTVALWLGVLLFALFWIPGVGYLIGIMLDGTLRFMNWIVLYIDSLPYALLQGISISVPESWFIYAIVIGIVIFLYYHRNSFLIGSLAALTLLLTWNSIEKVQHLQQKKLIVYCVPQTTAIDFISGTNHLFIADSSLLNDYDRMLFHIKHNWWDRGLHTATVDFSENLELPFLKRENQFIQFLDQRIIFLDKDFRPATTNQKMKADYIILSKDARVKINELAGSFEFNKIIFDSSNSTKKVRYWKRDCDNLGIEYYDVNEKGAFIAEI